MKRAWRILCRVLAVSALTVLVAIVCCVDGVDTRLYLKEPYHRQTLERWTARRSTNTLVRGELSAGFGRARLSPTLHAPSDDPEQGKFRVMPLAGYGNRQGRPATGVHDDVEVKAVALRVDQRVVVMVGADALIVPREVADLAAQQLAERPGLSREQLYLSATHTHCSLGAWGEKKIGEAFAGPFQPGSRTWFASRIVEAVRAAVADLRPAELGAGSFLAPEFIRNRLMGTLGQVDPEFSYLVLRQTNGRQAVLGSYSAHATVLSGDVMDFSADYPGAWQQAVEAKTGGLAVFLAGGVGSHGPVAGAPSWAGVERMGQALAARLLQGLTHVVMTNRVELDAVGLPVTLPELNARLTDGLRLRPWLTKKLLPVAADSYIQAVRLGSSIWISTPCDFSGELALVVKDSLRARGFHGVVTSFNGDYLGYVIPGCYYHLNGYEPRVMSFYGPYVPDYLMELIRELSQELARR